MVDNFYFYKAFVTDVYDGDTITVDIDLGFWTTIRKQKIRLHGINAPEVRGESRQHGIESRDWLRKMLLDKEIVLESIKDSNEKYGRILGIIHLRDTAINESGEVHEWININEKMVALGLAKTYLL